MKSYGVEPNDLCVNPRTDEKVIVRVQGRGFFLADVQQPDGSYKRMRYLTPPPDENGVSCGKVSPDPTYVEPASDYVFKRGPQTLADIGVGLRPQEPPRPNRAARRAAKRAR